jgi:hypothetical protein
MTMGRLLVIVAFVGGAYLASLDAESVNWLLFAPLMLVGAVGVVLVKRAARAAANHGDRLASDRGTLAASLDNIIGQLEQLAADKDRIPTYEMRFEIDRRLREDLENFAAARDSMKSLFGLQAYADVMSDFAAGERYINRVWSASTDGYQDEVRQYVDRSLRQFREARAVYRRYAGVAAPQD